MTARLARLGLAALLLGIVALGLVIAPAGARPTGTTGGYGTGTADAYLDQVAAELARPGLWVDPSLVGAGLDADDVTELDALAARTPGPVRVAVIPADAVRRDGFGDDPSSSYAPLAYADDELVGQLYDRVGVDGTYALLVVAPSAEQGRSFGAFQYAEERPFYDVQGAVDDAVDCCAPDYDRMLRAFLDEAGDEEVDGRAVLGWTALGAVVLGGGGYGLSKIVTGRRRRREGARVADALRPSLDEEVVELSRRVAALPPAPPAPPQPTTPGLTDPGYGVPGRTRRVLDLVEEARHRLDASEGDARMDTASEVEDVVRRLADARYELVAIDALRRGEPVPEPTAPCFFDPRHGPSTTERTFAPEGGSDRPVPVCARCAESLDAGQRPAARELTVDGTARPYWDWDLFSRPYVNGYWQRHAFSVERVQQTRYGAPARSWGTSRTFSWSSGTGWSSGGGSGRRSGAGSSGRRRSFGGGRSRRSSRRSGRSRRF
ncbi:hypothetical protein [Nocardioides flavescens]|uniref:TPM domain-containing protein n=1 Tax=Nocardioides flavescens TaxID=2691959 RepID=A0A6L7ET51_9ACTN|nr:hypothetical protein [Nocardioides flavescens]MXG89880.1 hypothetical protein [Nocardioides flavescens]